MNFYWDLAMFKASGSLTITGKKKEMAVRIVDRTFLQCQSVELFRPAHQKSSNT
jgi:hypothetical protein